MKSIYKTQYTDDDDSIIKERKQNQSFELFMRLFPVMTHRFKSL